MRTVLLWHIDIPAGALGPDRGEMPHYDWLLEREDPAALLIAFRTPVRVDAPSCERFSAVRAADHRQVYLDFEGELPGARGRVRRVAAGSCRVLEEEEGRLAVEVDFGDGGRVWEGTRLEGEAWEFVPRSETRDRK